MGAYLLLEGSASGRSFPLERGSSWAIGRGETCAVALDSRAVSRLHALVQQVANGQYCVIDLGSRNGSFVNARRVSVPVTLTNGDRLTFGDQALIFRTTPDAVAAPQVDEEDLRKQPTTSVFTHTLTTILVVDIRDFTKLARAVSEEVLSQTIGTWFLRTGNIAQRRGSWAQKYSGDAVMSVWVHGSQGSTRNELLEVLRTVDEMRKATAELHEQFPLPARLRIGAGVNSGFAVIGSVDFTALGDTVNTAFRLQDATRGLRTDLALSQAALDALRPSEEERAFFTRREAHLKGYELPVAAWTSRFEELERYLASMS